VKFNNIDTEFEYFPVLNMNGDIYIGLRPQ